MTFDIQNYKDLSSSDLKIMNLKYHINKVEKSETSQVTRELSADVTNIPVGEADKYNMEVNVKLADGVVFNSWSAKEHSIYDSGSTFSSDYRYVESPNNRVIMTIYFSRYYSY